MSQVLEAAHGDFLCVNFKPLFLARLRQVKRAYEILDKVNEEVCTVLGPLVRENVRIDQDLLYAIQTRVRVAMERLAERKEIVAWQVDTLQHDGNAITGVITIQQPLPVDFKFSISHGLAHD